MQAINQSINQSRKGLDKEVAAPARWRMQRLTGHTGAAFRQAHTPTTAASAALPATLPVLGCGPAVAGAKRGPCCCQPWFHSRWGCWACTLRGAKCCAAGSRQLPLPTPPLLSRCEREGGERERKRDCRWLPLRWGSASLWPEEPPRCLSRSLSWRPLSRCSRPPPPPSRRSSSLRWSCLLPPPSPPLRCLYDMPNPARCMQQAAQSEWAGVREISQTRHPTLLHPPTCCKEPRSKRQA